MSLELVFLGSGGTIQVPSFNCTCKVCEEARREKRLQRTRASAALLGKESVIIDASPDLPSQLEREGIRKVDRVFLTHWHFDHVWGLAELVEPAFCSKWPPVDIYLPRGTVGYFQNAMGYMRDHVALYPVEPGDIIELPDANWEVVKTNHTESSVGYIVNSWKRLAYLLDSHVPSKATIERLKEADILVLGALDELVPPEGEERWLHFSLLEAVDFWGRVGTDLHPVSPCVPRLCERGDSGRAAGF